MLKRHYLNTEAHWYAVYTRPRHEKRVAEQLSGRSVEWFLPQFESLRRWKDRRVRLALPLFRGYVFVRIPLARRLRVLEVSSVVRLVQFKGQPAPLPEDTIERLRSGLTGFLRAEPYPFLRVGRRVRILRGPLEGLEGILLRRRGVLRVVVSLELIHRSLCVEVDSDAVEPIHTGKPSGSKVESCRS